MPQQVSDDPGRFEAHVDAWDDHDEIFKGLTVDYNEERESIGGLRRRRRRAANAADDPIKTVSLVEQDGVLYWRDDIPAPDIAPAKLDIGPRARRRLRRAGLDLPPVEEDPVMQAGPLVLTRTFPVLKPNKIVAAVGAIDQKLNPALDASLRSWLRPLQPTADGKFSLGKSFTGKLEGRTLLFVHGTFSNAGNMLDEFEATDEGARFLKEATSGTKKYDNVVFFEHATLAVSPIINALELGRFFANASGQIDVIAHSRGGLVVRWWLEAFGKSLSILPTVPVRAVLVGSPLKGTSLAAPDKLQDVLSLLSNIGAFAEATFKVVGGANPFIWVAGALVQVVVSATGALARTPLVDGLVALVPGLSGQSLVNNNHEIDRLRLGPCAVDPLYYAVKSNFQTPNPGWKFWQNFRALRAGDLAADFLFPDANDLVVDTDSMTDLGGPEFAVNVRGVHDFGISPTVWHCNYFRQPETINFITSNFP
jgi:hypothetical protein